MNFDFEKFKEFCHIYYDEFNRNAGMLDLRNRHDRRAFTDYMLNNNIEHTPFGRSDPFVYVGTPDGCVYGSGDSLGCITYTIQDFLTSEFFDVGDILDFLEV